MKRILYLSLLSAITFISNPTRVGAQSVSDVALAGDVAIVPRTPISDWVVTFLPYLLIPLAVLIVLVFTLKTKKTKKKSAKK